jgi:hypothetical protein
MVLQKRGEIREWFLIFFQCNVIEYIGWALYKISKPILDQDDLFFQTIHSPLLPAKYLENIKAV